MRWSSPIRTESVRDKLLILRLLLRELKRLEYPFDEALCDAAFRMYHGDMVALGRGEVLIPG
jgi:hypothetical protein